MTSRIEFPFGDRLMRSKYLSHPARHNPPFSVQPKTIGHAHNIRTRSSEIPEVLTSARSKVTLRPSGDEGLILVTVPPDLISKLGVIQFTADLGSNAACRSPTRNRVC